ncbi:MAG: ferrous iron transport protein B [Elusimicrobia bacterium]|nr:ferrous iron transport protein B [Elusimicrobiota bacterium]
MASPVLRVALVGRPNVGKSVLFHALTGRYAAVSNYSGTTLDLRSAPGPEGLEVIDTPGLFSLEARTDDEAVTRDLLAGGGADVLVQVADACDPEGALVLALDLARLALPGVLVLNLADEAEARGVASDVEALSAALGIPVLLAAATQGRGLAALRAALERAAPAALPPLPPELGAAAARVADALPAALRPRALALLLAEGDARRALGGAALGPSALDALERERARFSRRPAFLYLQAARERAAELAAACVRRAPPGAATGGWLEAAGRWSLHPVAGPVAALAVLAALYWFVGVLGAQTLVSALEEGVFGAWLTPAAGRLVSAAVPWPLAREVLVGPYGAVSMALTYAFALILPIVATFFIAFSVLEDSGYLPRFSVVTDRLFRAMGLNGKAVLPVLLGLGCGTMAIVTTRILETRRERVLVSFLLTLMVPCSAQLGVILGMAGASGTAVPLCWLAVMAATVLGVGWAAARVMPGAAPRFVVDIPPMRLPQAGNVARKVASRLRWYLAEIVPMFVLATFALFVLDKTGGLTFLERAASPLVSGWLGLPREATGALLTGFLRRDYGAAGLFDLQRAGNLDPRQTAVSLVTITLFMPCFAQWLMTLREHGWRVSAWTTGLVTAYALGAAGAVNALWRAFGG